MNDKKNIIICRCSDVSLAASIDCSNKDTHLSKIWSEFSESAWDHAKGKPAPNLFVVRSPGISTAKLKQSRSINRGHWPWESSWKQLLQVKKMKTKIIIIGAGISGVSIAYNLAKMGQDGIVVIEKAYMTSGATGRCGAGVRQQWGTKGNCEMAQRSVKFFETAKETLGYAGDIEFMQEGYLILATTKDEGTVPKECGIAKTVSAFPKARLVKEALEIVLILIRSVRWQLSVRQMVISIHSWLMPIGVPSVRFHFLRTFWKSKARIIRLKGRYGQEWIRDRCRR